MGNTTRLQNFMRHKDQQGSEESSLDQCQRRDQESSSSSYLLMHEVTLVFIHFLILSRATGGVGKVRVNPHEFEKTKTKKNKYLEYYRRTISYTPGNRTVDLM